MDTINLIKVKAKEIDGISVEFCALASVIVRPRKNANVQYGLFDGDKKMVSAKSLLIQGEDYNKWGIDDSYMEDLILSKNDLEREIDGPYGTSYHGESIGPQNL